MPTRPRAAGPIAALLATLCLLLAVPTSGVAGTWSVGEITGPAGTTDIVPRAVNIHGVVVGTARFPGDSTDTAFRWEDGTMLKLALPGAMYSSRALDINDAGLIVGYGYHPAGGCSYPPLQGIVWTATKTTSSASMTSFNTYLSGAPGSGDDCTHGSSINGINNSGTMVGRAGYKTDDDPKWGVARVDKPATTTGGAWSSLDLPDLRTDSGRQIYGGDAYAINDNGAIVGYGGPSGDYARLWNTTAPYPVDLLPGPHGLNGLGHVVGRTAGSSGFHARMWNGTDYLEIGAAENSSAAYAINDSGWVVGRAGTNSGTTQLASATAMLWEVGDTSIGNTPLYSLAPAGWSMYSALDINEDGMIVGTGKHGSDAVGYWMAPAAVAFQLTGTVRDGNGHPIAGAVIVATKNGVQAGSATSGADGTYTLTLNRGTYAVAVSSPAGVTPDTSGPCTVITGGTCQLSLSQNRSLDFKGSATSPGDGNGSGGGSGGNGSGGGSGGGSGTPPILLPPPSPPIGEQPQVPGPPISFPKSGKKVAASSSRRVSISIGPVDAGTKAQLSLETKQQYKVDEKLAATASRKKKRKKVKANVTLGETAKTITKTSKNAAVRFKLSKDGYKFLKGKKSLKVVVTLTLTGANGGTSTAKRMITLRAPKQSKKK